MPDEKPLAIEVAVDQIRGGFPLEEPVPCFLEELLDQLRGDLGKDDFKAPVILELERANPLPPQPFKRKPGCG